MEKYEVKDVLFGLRTEYIKIEEELNKIREMVTLTQKNDKVMFSILREKDKETDKNITSLKLNLLRRQSFILSLIQKIGKNVAGLNDKTTDIAKTFSGDLHRMIIGNSEIILPEGVDANDLYKSVENVISSDMVRNTPHIFRYNEPYSADVGILRELNISALGLNVNSWETKTNHQTTPSEFVSYVLDGDMLKYACYYDLAMSPSLSRCLHSQVDADLLNPIEKKIIDNSDVRNKKLTIEEYSILNENQDFSIEDTHDEIILRKK